MVDITSDMELNQILLGEMAGIVDEVAEQLLDKLISDSGFIEQIVYGAGIPNWYQRNKKSGGLLGEWDTVPIKITGNTVTGEVKEFPERMKFNPSEFVHGSYYWVEGITDIRKLLVDFITEGWSGPLFGETGFWLGSRDFWTPFVKLLEDGTVSKMFEKAFRSRGIKFKKL